MTHRVFNFSAGPAALPEPVLRQAAEEMLDWKGSGMSVMEISHRSPAFMEVHQQALADLRELMSIPPEYKVLFMQGGGLGENAIVPLNLMGRDGVADFVISGQWSAKSAREAARYGQVHVAADAKDSNGAYRSVPPQSTWKLAPRASYLHLCSNETIDGVEFDGPPAIGDGPGDVPPDRPIVADVSSNILSRHIDVSRYGCLFGGAQKNIGPAGLTLVIVREDLLGRAHPLTPSVFDYRVVADNDSMFNTPPTYSIYLAGLVFRWLKAQGGVPAMEARNIEKARRLYHAIDSSSLYVNRVEPRWRSRMNVTFFLRDERLNEAFLAGAREAGLAHLKGHRVVGGMRASIYNAMPIEGVDALIAYLRDFEQRRG